MENQVIATVSSLSGVVFVRNAEGMIRTLKAGDNIRAGDTVINQNGGTIVLKSLAGESVELTQQSAVKVTDELFGFTAPSAISASMATDNVELLLQTLAQGGELDNVLEATAAGLAGGGEGGGHGFVVLDGVTVSVDDNLSALNSIPLSNTILTRQDDPFVILTPRQPVDLVSPTVTLTEDANNDGVINATELSGDIDVRIDLPAGTVAGDSIRVSDGTITRDIVLSAQDIINGNIVTGFPSPGEGNSITITAEHRDQFGNVSAPGTDSARVDTLAGLDGSAPTVTLTEDANNDGVINATELSGDIDVRIDLPAGTVAGDSIRVSDGTITRDIVLSAQDIINGNIVTGFPSPGEGNSITITAEHRDQFGNVSAPGTDSARVDTLAGLDGSAPTVTLTEDANNDGVINATELSGDIDVRIDLPAGTVAGDSIRVSDGTITRDIVLSAQDIINGNIVTGFPSPGEGNSITITAEHRDQFGNVSAPGTDSARVDTLAGLDGSAPTVTLTEDANNDGVINATELSGDIDVRIDLPAGTVAGDSIRVSDGTITRDIVLSAQDIINGNIVTGFPSPGEGNSITITAEHRDQFGNVSAPGRDTATLNTLPPALAISLDANVAGDGIVNAAESVQGQIPVTGTVSGQFNAGDTVTVTVNGKTFTGPVSNIGTFSINVPGADLAADADSTVEASVSTTNAAGNSNTATDTQTYTVNTQAPALAISLDANVAGDGIVNAAESVQGQIPVTGTVSGQFNAGDTVTVTVNGKTFTGPVSNSGTFSINVPGADLAADADSTVEASVSTTNAAGNSNTATDTQTYTVNTQAPALAISLDANVAGDGIVNAAESVQGQIPVTGTVSGQFNAGDTVTVTVNGKTFTGPVSNIGTFSINVPGADLAADADSTVEASVSTTNAAGNSNTATDTQTYTVNTQAPALAISLDANVAGDGIVNAAESVQGQIPVTGTVSGQFNAGDTVTVTVNGKTFTGPVSNIGTFSINVPGADLAADADSTVEASVSTTNAAGNSNTATDTQTYTVNTQAPALAISLDANVAGDGIVNAAESVQGQIPVTGTVSGQFNAGDTVTVTVNGKTFTGPVSNIGTFSINVPGADLAADADSTVEASVSTTNAAGNSNTATDTQTYTVNTQAPALAISLDANVAGDGIVNAAESVQGQIPVTGTVSGQFNAGDTVTVTVNGKTFTGPVSNIGTFSINVPGADLAADADSTVEASVSTTNAAGNSNTATDTQTYTVNTQAPALAISLDANVAGDGIVNAAESVQGQIPVTGTVSGQFNAGDTVTVTVNGKTFTGPVSNSGTFSINVPGADLAADADSTVEASVSTTNAAGNGNTATDTQTYTVNTQAPALAISLDANVAGDGIVNAAESVQGQIPVTGTVSGQFNAGDTVTVTVNGKTFTGPVSNSGTFSINVPGADLAADADSTVEASVSTTNAAGNSNTATDTQTYTVNTQAPALAISLDANVAGDGIVNAAESVQGQIPVTGTVSGQFNAGDTVTVTVNGKTFTGPVSNSGTFSINVPGADLAADADSTVEASVSTTNAAGNSNTATDTQTYTVNTQAPALAISLDANVAGDGIVNAAESVQGQIPVTGTVSGQFNAGDTVTVTVNGKTFTGPVSNSGTFSINVPGADLAADADSTVEASVSTTNAAGNSNTATDTQNYGLATSGLVALIALDANFGGDGIINIEESQSSAMIPVTGTVGGDAKLGDPVVVSLNGKDYATSVITRADGKLGFSVVIAGNEFVSDSDKTIDARVTVTDAAGNVASQSTQLTYSLDLTAPVAEIALDANFGGDGIINIEESQSSAMIPVTGTVGGDAKLGDPVVVSLNGKDYATSVITRADGKLGFSVVIAGNEFVSDSDKTIDARVTVTDAAGNVASQSTQLTYSLDLTAPVAEIALDANFGGDGIINIEESQSSAMIPVTGTVGGDAKLGDPVVVSLNGKDYATSVITRADGKLGFSVVIAGNEFVSDSDKTIDARVTVTDAAGNVASQSTQLTYSLDLTAPVAEIALDANFGGDGIINIEESQSSAMIPVTGTVGGDAKLGDPVVVSLNGKDYATSVITRADGKLGFSVVIAGNEFVSDSDKTIDARVTVTDAAGNVASQSTQLTYSLDLTAPVAEIALDANFGGDGIINIEESQSSAMIPVTGTVGGDAKLGDPVVVSLNGKDYATSVITRADGKLGFSVVIAGNEFVSDSDKTIDARVTVTDAAGNVASQSTQLTYSLDLTAPVAEIALDANFGGDGIINIEESQSSAMIPVTGTVGGDAKLGDPVVVSLNGKDYATSVITRADGKLGFSVVIAGNEFVSDSDKTIDARVTVTDAAGNVASQSTQLTYSLDLTAPVAEIALDANFGGDGIINIEESQSSAMIPVTGTVGGDAKLGDPVVVSLNGKDYATSVITRADGKLGFSVVIAGNEFVSDSDKTIDARVTVTDAAGNVASQSTQLTYSLDLTAPVAEIALDANFGGDGIINIEESQSSAMIPVTGTVGGDAKLGDPVVVSLNGKDYATSVITRADGKLGFSVVIAGNEFVSDSDKTIDARVTVTDAAGNVASQSTQLTYSLDLTAPVAEIALDANFGGDGIINIEESQSSAMIPVTGTVGGDAKLGDPVVVSLNGKDYATSVITRADGKLGFSVVIAGNEFVSDSDKTIDARVTVTDAAGNVASQSTQLTYPLHLNPPSLTNDDGLTALEDTPLSISAASLLANDTDLDGDTLTIVDVRGAENGNVALDANGNVVFTPNPNYSGPAKFIYVVNDGMGGISEATVNMNVVAVADMPTLSATIDNAVVLPPPNNNNKPVAILKQNGGSVLGLIDVAALNSLNIADRQNFAVFDADQDITKVELFINNGLLANLGLGGITGESKFFVNTTNLPSDIIVSGNGTTSLSFSRINGGTFTNDEMNALLSRVSIKESGLLVSLLNTDLRVLNSISIKVTDSNGNTDTAADADLIDLNLINTPNPNLGMPGAVSGGTSNGGDRTYVININSALIDRDGSETLTIVIGGVPNGVSLSNAVDNGDGTWTVDIAGMDVNQTITMTVPATQSQNFTLTVTAKATEASNGSTSVTTQTIEVVVPNTAPINTAPEVGASGTALLGILGLDVLNIINGIETQAFTAIDVNNNLKSVTLTAAELVGVRLGTGHPIQVDQALAATLGLKVTPSQAGLNLLGLVTLLSSYSLTIEAIDGGTIDNIKINQLLSTVSVDKALVDVAVLNTLRITATDVEGLSDTARIGTLASVSVIGGDSNSSGNATHVNALPRIEGTTDNDSLQGASSNEAIFGREGNDVLKGGSGNDVIYGGLGVDILVGQQGNDELYGGLGADVFRWELNDGGVAGAPSVDVIKDFNQGSGSYNNTEGDQIDLRDLLNIDNINDVNLLDYLLIEPSGNDLMVYISTQGKFANGTSVQAETDQVVVLENVSLLMDMGIEGGDRHVIQQLIEQGKLMID